MQMLREALLRNFFSVIPIRSVGKYADCTQKAEQTKNQI